MLGSFEGFFDKILVDAPCSGEGMFRKDRDMVKSWLEHGPEYYAPIQQEILRTGGPDAPAGRACSSIPPVPFLRWKMKTI